MTFKQKIYSIFLNNLDDKIRAFQANLNDLRESVLNETKSTAGDKHETALSMLQLEQSQVAKHMYNAVDAMKLFSQLNIERQCEFVSNGSLVKTNHGYFFIGVALPKVIVDGKVVLAISAKSPLGLALIGKKNTNKITLSAVTHTIESIL